MRPVWINLAFVLGLAFALGSRAAPVPPPSQPAKPPPVLQRVAPDAPAPGVAWCDSVVEIQTSARSGVASFWLANGVRVHHLRLPTRPGQVVVTISLCGGKLLEDATTRGVSEITAGVLDDWDTAAPEASKAAGVAGRDMRIDASAAQDSIVLRLMGSAGDLEPGLTVAQALLTRPTVDGPNVDGAREQVVRELRRRAADTTAQARVADALNQVLVPPDDVRLRPPDERSLAAIGPDNVKAWIERHAKAGGAPIEAAFVGDLSLADALRLADKSLGTLPQRPRASPDVDSARRVVKKPGGPIEAEVHFVDTPAAPGRTESTVVRGCFGPEFADLTNQRTLRAAARVAVDRLKPSLAEAGFARAPNAVHGSVYISAFRGLGMMLVTATGDEGARDKAAAEIDAELARLAKDGPSKEELARAAEELAKAADGFQGDPRYWSSALSRCTSLGIEPDEIATGAEFYRALTPLAVRDAVRKYMAPESKIALMLRQGVPATPVDAETKK